MGESRTGVSDERESGSLRSVPVSVSCRVSHVSWEIACPYRKSEMHSVEINEMQVEEVETVMTRRSEFDNCYSVYKSVGGNFYRPQLYRFHELLSVDSAGTQTHFLSAGLVDERLNNILSNY